MMVKVQELSGDMEKTFDKMFYDGVDDTERGFEPIDTITVRLLHAWNWDALMEQAVIYSFIQYWESEGEDMLEVYRTPDSWTRGRKWIYKGLQICYTRIYKKPELFFDDPVLHGDDHIYRAKTLEFIWKYRGLMWN